MQLPLNLILLLVLSLTVLNIDNYIIFYSLLILIFFYKSLVPIIKITKTPTALYFLIFAPICLISIPELFFYKEISNEIWINDNFQRHSIQFIYLLPLLLLPTMIQNSKFNEEYLFFTISIVCIIDIIFNIYLVFELKNDRSILNSNILWPIILYDYIVIALSILLFSYSIQRSERKFKLITFISIINIFIICLHGSKGAWLGIPICFLTLIILNKSRTKKIIIYLALLFLLIFSSTFLPNSQVLKRIDYLKIQTAEVLNNNPNNSVGVRLELWKHAIADSKKNSLIGNGFQKTYQNICELKKNEVINICQIHVHNVYLQFLYAYGLLGFIISILLFLVPILFYYKNRKVNSNIAFSGIAFCLYLSICSLTDYSFFYTPLTITYFLINTFLISFIIRDRSKLTYKNDFL